MKIGVFDSGIGGLTVLKEIKRLIPHADFIYVGDSANVPYGTKTKEELAIFVSNIVHFLEEEKVDLIVFACNTANSMLLKDMKKKFKTPLLGVIDSGSSLALKYAKKGIGIIATPNTIQSKAYERAISERNGEIPTYGIACYNLVNVIEKEIKTRKFNKEKVQEELKKVPKSEIDALILGCTHYPLAQEEIQKIVGKNIILINPALEVAKEVLIQSTNYSKGNGELIVYTSGSKEDFEEKVKVILNVETKVNTFIHKTKSF